MRRGTLGKRERGRRERERQEQDRQEEMNGGLEGGGLLDMIFSPHYTFESSAFK